MKIIRYQKDPGRVFMWCNACNMAHSVKVGPNGWTLTGTDEKPTIFPSMLTTYDWGPSFVPERCHLFVKDGQYQYLDDCTHSLRGQTVDMPDVPNWLKDE